MLFTDRELGCFAKDPAVVRFCGRYYLYYSLLFQDKRLGIGIAVSDDMEEWQCRGSIPLDMPCEANGIGAPGSWNSSESGHPFAFRDEDGQMYLFYQGSADNGKTWYLSKARLSMEDHIPVLLKE